MNTKKHKSRKPAVAGMFYPGTKQQLEETVAHYLQKAQTVDLPIKKLYGLIAPHAGYVYSGGVAASGYRLLKDFPMRTVLIIAPSHSEPFDYISVYEGEGYETPLGEIPVATPICEQLVQNSTVAEFSENGHRSEHSLEVQLPFLQLVLGEMFRIVPVVVGAAQLHTLNEFARNLAKIANENPFLVIASSDLSHYHSYNTANRKDRHLIGLLEDYDLDFLEKGYRDRSLEACGLGPILILMNYARLIGKPQCRQIQYQNSGDVSGMKSQVVGYLSAAVFES